MKNWEKYEKKIRALRTIRFGVTAKGEVNYCSETGCRKCIFEMRSEDNCCSERALEWLYSEYKEPKLKLTKEEKAFVDAIVCSDYHIRRNIDGLFLYGYIVSIGIKPEMFPFIDSEKDWSIEELKALEVEE